MSSFNLSQQSTTQQYPFNLISSLWVEAPKLGQVQQEVVAQLQQHQANYFKQLFELQTAFFNPGALLSHQLSFNCATLATLMGAHQQVSELTQQQLTQAHQQLRNTLQQIVDEVPSNAEPVAAMLKSMLITMNDTYQQAHAGGQQAVKLTHQIVKYTAEQTQQIAAQASRPLEQNISDADASDAPTTEAASSHVEPAEPAREELEQAIAEGEKEARQASKAVSSADKPAPQPASEAVKNVIADDKAHASVAATKTEAVATQASEHVKAPVTPAAKDVNEATKAAEAASPSKAPGAQSSKNNKGARQGAKP